MRKTCYSARGSARGSRGHCGRESERERKRERQEVTSPSICTRPDTRLWRLGLGKTCSSAPRCRGGAWHMPAPSLLQWTPHPDPRFRSRTKTGLVDRLSGTSLGGVPREQKTLKGHLPRVVYRRVYFSIRRLERTHQCKFMHECFDILAKISLCGRFHDLTVFI